MLLHDQVAIVTGAGRGIGRGVALGLAKEGARVAVVDANELRAKETVANVRQAGGRACVWQADITQGEQVRSVVHQVAQEWGRIDILVNNAGILSTTPVLELTEAEWSRVLAVNLTGVFLCSQAAAEVMVKQGSGRIINIASTAAIFGVPNQSAYSASKHAVLGFTKSFAAEIGVYGVTVNAVCPGNTDTEMLREVFDARAASRGMSVEELMQGIVAKTPLGRLAQPDDIADVVVFLASAAARYITGQAITVCGGRTVNLS